MTEAVAVAVAVGADAVFVAVGPIGVEVKVIVMHRQGVALLVGVPA